MFYSQFILAKKGPLGTIWIAAHLERKLRKNQVADTDIGVSVDSILFPDMPIALRLSSHLLLGVVRIYSRKVNYLFDDCSEALLKVKQAFRSAAVDLPPEESKAPYHSITLPETFDLDDFELPENDMFQGNFVDHHISSKEQITLQDTMEGVSYSTSKFGLDERFGDGDTSGLDLDEDLILEKIGAAGSSYESADPQASVGPMNPLNQDKHLETRANNAGNMVGGVNEYADGIDYAQAPGTPGLMEEPNLSKAHEVSACDDLIDSESHLMEGTDTVNATKITSDDKQGVNWGTRNKTNSDSISFVQTEENGYSGGLKSNPQGETPIEASLENVSVQECLSGSKPTFDSRCEDDARDTAPELVDKVIEASADFQNGDADKPEFSSHLVDQSGHDDHRGQSLPLSIGAKASPDSSSSNLDVHEKVSSTENYSLKPCNSNLGHSDKPVSLCGLPNDSEVQLDDATFLTSGGEETALLGKAPCAPDNLEQGPKDNLVEEHTLPEDKHITFNEPDSQDRSAGNLNNSAETELPGPEKLLSVPEGVTDLHTDMLIEGNYGGLDGLGEDNSGSKLVSAKKRTLTESTLTEQSLNSAESSRRVRFKKTAESLPDDDDLLSSILVGRSSALKVKPTPTHSEVTSSKWTRSTTRTTAAKRKVLMDDTMVLHGDMIRKQLMDTEDIRRVRKKAPCTRPEISMIKNQLLEDEIFLEPIFDGMSVQLVSLHSQVSDLDKIRVFKNDLDSTLATVGSLPLKIDNDVGDGSMSASHNKNNAEPNFSSQKAEDDDLFEVGNDQSASKPNDAEQMEAGPSDLLHSSNEVTEPGDNPLLGDDTNKVVERLSPGVEFNQEHTDAPDAMAVIPDLPEDVPSTAPDCVVMDAENVQVISKDEVTENEGVINNAVADEPLRMDDFPAVDGATTELPTDVKYSEMEDSFQNEMRDFHLGDVHHITDSSYPSEIGLWEDGFMNNGEDPEQREAYRLNVMDAETSALDLHDQGALDYSAAGDDTEFLNVDDEELNDAADDPDDEEAKFAENTGWSSRTRAVSKYLQTMFVKEAEHGRKSLSMDKLLTSKSRKEASRMFFETLVLKTRDYIHVEQQNPVGDISIKPRTRLMKSSF